MRKTAYWGLTMCLWGGIALIGVIGYYATTLPPLDRIMIPDRPPSLTILDINGETIARAGAMRGQAVNISELPPHVTQAVIAIEDRRFRSHFGIDPIGLARAAYRNFTAGSVEEGGSTITQQLAKNLFLSPDRSLERKAQEAILAVWLEARLSKDEILEHYLNRVYFGAGAYGIEAASWTYFDKPASQINLQEAAILAGLLKAPSRLSPARNPEAAEQRGALVLQAMVDTGFIDASDAAGALTYSARPPVSRDEGNFGYIADWVSDIVPDLIGHVEGDLVIHTTIDRAVQNHAQKALAEMIANEGEKNRVSQGAIVILDGRGRVKALVGGTSHRRTPFNRAVQARRQPGSSFKPFVFAAALERGLEPHTMMVDAPISLGGWSPENYGGEFIGPVSVQDALARSINTVAVRVAQHAGLQNVVGLARASGLNLSQPINFSIALGTKEVSPLEITAAYLPFMNGGYAATPLIVERIETAEGEVIYDTPFDLSQQVMSEHVVWGMENLLRHAVTSGTGRRAAFPGWPVMGKTGTTQNSRDAWFVGYTPRLVGSVWLGNDDNSPMRNVTGGGLPATLWREVMEMAHQNLPELPPEEQLPRIEMPLMSEPNYSPLPENWQGDTYQSYDDWLNAPAVDRPVENSWQDNSWQNNPSQQGSGGFSFDAIRERLTGEREDNALSTGSLDELINDTLNRR